MIYMRFLIMTLALMMLPMGAQAQEATPYDAMPGGLYKLDKNHASLIWKVSHMGLSNYTARFTDFDADIMYDPMDIEKSKLRVTIDPTSVETDYKSEDGKDFNKDLGYEAGWFNASQYPDITFNSTKIEKTGDNTAKVTGDLKFLGVTKPVTLDVTLNKAMGNHPMLNKPFMGFSATGTIKRSDFGMTKYIPQIGDEVTLNIETEFMYAK